MQLKRGSAPETVEREIDVDLTREEVIAILGAYLKRKIGTDKLRFDDISVIAGKDAAGQMVFSGATMLGVEILPLQYAEDHAPVKVGTPPAASCPPVTKVAAPKLPTPLQDLAAAAAAQASEVKK
jgi:hypothetical protein